MFDNRPSRYHNLVSRWSVKEISMSTTNFNLRGVDSCVMSLLKQEAEKRHISINFLILKCIEMSLGYSHKINRPTYHDLDYLAGTWDKKDAK